MKFSHKKQAFLLTCLIFTPLLLFPFFENSFSKDVKADNNLNLVIGQFVVKEHQSLLPPSPKPKQENKQERKAEKEKSKKVENIDKKQAKKDIKKPEKLEETKAAAATNSAPQIETLMIGKDNNEFLKAVKQAIDKATIDTYPRQARQMRLTGVVSVEFAWLDGSRLGFVRIVQSSGHRILDDNAIKAIKRASRNFPSYEKNVKVTHNLRYNLS